MELGQARRPRSEVATFNDLEPRKKCSVCCGLRCAAFIGGFTFIFTLLCNSIILGGKLTEGRGLIGFCDRNLFIALPLAAVTFTHHLILSESLWSKNRKTVWEINWQSTFTNMTLWTVGTTMCTLLSRKFLSTCSRTYRMLMWDYYRTRRGCANPWCPSLYGRISADLDWYNIFWTLSFYHIVWSMFAIMLEKEMGAQYAMFFRDWKYSKWCSPRWREWRELEVLRNVHTEHKVASWRWGSFLTNSKWHIRGQ
ncbi:unnamed protein product [Phytomonas sp. EM1]|nr:unnamed protein product [Phytomonas sp. EM1]|eukprot:CCW64683.1 unnamed protein product [Phytomonas sp. isolate EM1]